jgi:Cu(I)/Ag(I) efflux system protein CusF
MNSTILILAAGALALAGCGQAQNSGRENGAQAQQAAQTYSGTGKVTAVAGNHVTIDHGPIEGIGWPAMTMAFTAPKGMANGIAAGDQVAFSFRQDGSAYRLTSLQKQ